MTKRKLVVSLIIILILAAVFGYNFYHVVVIVKEYQRNDAIYDNVRNEVFRLLRKADNGNGDVSGDLPEEPDIMPYVDFEALRKLNFEAVAWLWIPDTDINYPIMQSGDNDKYLHYAFDGSRSVTGSIFLDYRNIYEFTDSHNIIYGHNMKNGAMFADLSMFGKPDYTAEHRYIYVITDTKIRQYKIFSQYLTTVGLNSYKINFSDDAEFDDYFTRLQKYSTYILDNDEAINEDCRQIVTLSTCVSDKIRRRVIHAALVNEYDNLYRVS